VPFRTIPYLDRALPGAVVVTHAEDSSLAGWIAPSGAAPEPIAPPRRRLFRKYALLVVGLVGAALLINSGFDFWFSYQENKAALVRVQQEKAEAAAQRIAEFVEEIKSQIGWTTHAQWAVGPLDQRRQDYVRLQRQVPAITELSQLDGQGRERLKVSRISSDVVDGGADFSQSPAFTEAKAHRTWFSPVYFRKESEPYMTLAMARDGKNAGVTVAEINLKLLFDVITALKIGQGGYVYVVDGRGRLIAHPDISLVLRDTDLSKLPQVAAALAPTPGDSQVTVAKSLGDRSVLTAHAAIPQLGWRVFVEVPLSEAFAPLYGAALRTLALLALGLIAATLVALVIARRMTGPIRALQQGAAEIGAGDLGRRIDIHTGDELEGLAQQFNRMAADLQKSYAELEQRVADRTAELSEALDQQTATAEVLGVINSSPGDLGPVFDSMLEKAMRLCGAAFGELRTYDGERFQLAATRGIPRAYVEYYASQETSTYGPGTGPARILAGDRIVHVPDLVDTEPYRRGDPDRRALVDLGGARAIVLVPLLKDDAVRGFILIFRQEPGPFSDKQIALLQNFAAQAVIAMENARLLGELQQRTGDLQESLEYQTATSDVLKVISRSDAKLGAVLDTLTETAARICEADQAVIHQLRGGLYHVSTSFGFTQEYKDHVARNPIAPGRGTATGRMALERQVVHIEDTSNDPEYTGTEIQRLGGFRTVLAVPLFREDAVIGSLLLTRLRVEAFTEKQIALVTTFADQAVIAIENARLLDEIRQRQAELRVTFDNMADGVVMFDEDLRLAAWNRNFQEIVDLPDDFLAAPQTYADYIRYLARRGEFGEAADPEAELARYRERASEHYSFERTRPDGRVIEVRHNPMPDGGFVLIYSDITERKRSEAEIRAARDAAEATLRDLRAAQANLIQAEKMASLGQLTAGIAHEIKNPLNFVNNFAGLSGELLEELKETTAPALAALDDEKRAEIDETIEMLTSNLEKIAEHGTRADNIVKSMLEHSRGVSGERREVDLNSLIEEALNLAYHGARAQDAEFNIALERELDRNIARIELAPQEMTRVFLNLFGNSFYAATKRQRDGAGPSFRPTLTVVTRDRGEAIEVRVRDNGTGIRPEIRDKLFQPFVTTKPTGEGTGLGLSISYDIVTQQHGGTIEVDSAVDEFTEFTIRLPRNRGSERSRNAT
jgi:signal transduction histidine kinase